MKKRFTTIRRVLVLAALLAGGNFTARAQTGGVGIGTTAPDPSAALDIVSSTKGALLPRVAAASAIASPATGLLVYQTGVPAGFYYNAGDAMTPNWQQIATGTGAALTATNGLTKTGSAIGLGGTLTGNTTLGLGGFSLGLTGGGVGIGTSSPAGLLDVNGPTRVLSVDQQNTTSNLSINNILSYWQSFTAGISGTLDQVVIYDVTFDNIAGSNQQPSGALLTIYQGTGTGGAVVATQSFTMPASSTSGTTVTFGAPAALVAGQVYTFGVGLVSPPTANTRMITSLCNNCYAGGSNSISGSYDAKFQTVVGTLGGAQSLLLVQNGKVGIGTGTPLATLHVGGASGTVRIDGLAGSGSRLVALASDGSLTATSLPLDAQTLSLSGNTLFISGSNSSVTLPGINPTNGLSGGGTTVYLGGSLTQATTIAQGAFPLGFTGAAGVGVGTAAPAASAQLEVASTTKGLLPPRLSTAQRDAIAGPAVGLMLYNSDTKKLEVWNGTRWTETLTTTEAVYQGPARTFAYTGGVQTYTVPAGVTSLTIDALGAQGGEVSTLGGGGPGARVQTTLAVTPGEVLSVLVGGAGFPPFSAGPGAGAGYNGGGAGQQSSGGGGGATDIRRGAATLNDRLVVAAGGGGAGSCTGGVSYAGGGGGAPNGGTGSASPTYYQPGQGATQTAGGAGGLASQSGSFGQGGAGSDGGGGGGYYGGGGGACSGGGGGSSWVIPAGTSGTTMTAATNYGAGQLTLTPGLSRPAPVLDGANFVNVPGDNLGNHTATQNLNLAANQLVGNGGTSGVSISSTGNVGIGTTAAPTQRLDVNGNVRVGAAGTVGKVLTSATGTNNMLAVAYGQMGASGPTTYSTSGNFTLARTGVGSYTLTFPASSGLNNVNFGDMPVVATLYGNAPGFVTVSGGTGVITVRTFNVTGTATDLLFNFSAFAQ